MSVSCAVQSRMTRCPRPYDQQVAADISSQLSWASGDTQRLISGAAGSSPYLAHLLSREATWLEKALEEPEAAFQEELQQCRSAPMDQLALRLRKAKRRIALLVGLLDLGGVWQLTQVTEALTTFADVAVNSALNAAIYSEIRRKKLKMLPDGAGASEAGIVAFAMGKMGAHELNYSSDIDLIMLIDENRYSSADWLEARASLIRATRFAMSMLSEHSAEGYVFRTDLRLRPDPSVTPVAIAMDAAERYYESVGRAWERAAWIKARPSAGDLEAGDRFIRHLKPFIWRRHLDFVAIREAHEMRLRIRNDKQQHGRIKLLGHDLKLGCGGIREIEFFTQTRQLIAGGRDSSLRKRGTLSGLEALTKSHWVPQEITKTLSSHYLALREAEHRVQMIHDAQTHLLPGNEEDFSRFVALSGREEKEYSRDLLLRLEEVHEIAETFFADENDSAAPSKKPITASDEITEKINGWRSFPALRSPRAVEHFEHLQPHLLNKLNTSPDPSEATEALGGFIKALPAGVQLFALFDANPSLLDLLVDVLVTAPALSSYLSKNTGVLDAVIAGDFFSPWPDKDTLIDAFKSELSKEEDYERCLDLARMLGKEHHFRIGVHLLRGLISPEEASREYALLAEAIIAALFPIVEQEVSRRHGSAPGDGAAVLAMGSLGAGRLAPDSDLDLILLYNAEPSAMSTGKKPIAASAWYAKLTKALMAALSAPTAEGSLYETDMRLRPSGHQGPIASRVSAWAQYQLNDAWAWEHLALSRARTVAGSQAVRDEIETGWNGLITQLSTSSHQETLIEELHNMMERIRSAKPPGGALDAKIGPGKLQEIELVAQLGLILTGDFSRSTEQGFKRLLEMGLLKENEFQNLVKAHELYWAVNLYTRLMGGENAPDLTFKNGLGQRLAKALNYQNLEILKQEMVETGNAASQILTRFFSRALDFNEQQL